MSDAPLTPVPRALFVRVLVAASLALLAAGAVTPLITTERFYFFSNTFSLISALRELAAQGQFVLAGALGLFSLCMPVVKAAVIWIAASGRGSRHALLGLAERFGKWSMLEVFVAALLITALKLGPVVAATLHYGAYLLASSVVLSGIASQLLPHARSAGPLFSGPMTLTAGAVGGAIVATALLGVLNPAALDFDVIVGTPQARCIERALELEPFRAAPNRTQREHVDALRAIETQNCPEAFVHALEDYVDAAAKLDALDANGPAPRSWLERAGARVGLVATRDDRLKDMEKAWAHVVRVAAEHGVQVPVR
jgi:paraquat-inducible protein A